MSHRDRFCSPAVIFQGENDEATEPTKSEAELLKIFEICFCRSQVEATGLNHTNLQFPGRPKCHPLAGSGTQLGAEGSKGNPGHGFARF